MEPEGKKRRISGFRLLLTTMVLLFLMITWALLMGGTLRAMEVGSGSMSPTLIKDDRVLVRDLKPEELKRGIVVTLKSPDGIGADLVKRIVAIPGDTVQYEDGVFLVNGKPSPPPGAPNFRAEDKTTNIYTLGENEYFVLGDNREKSLDSEEFGPVLKEEINGLVLFRYSPFNRLKSF